MGLQHIFGLFIDPRQQWPEAGSRYDGEPQPGRPGQHGGLRGVGRADPGPGPRRGAGFGGARIHGQNIPTGILPLFGSAPRGILCLSTD